MITKICDTVYHSLKKTWHGCQGMQRKPPKSFLVEAQLVKIEFEKWFGTGWHNATKLQGGKTKIEVNWAQLELEVGPTLAKIMPKTCVICELYLDITNLFFILFAYFCVLVIGCILHQLITFWKSFNLDNNRTVWCHPFWRNLKHIGMSRVANLAPWFLKQNF
jgi:hypothetical protein